MNWELDEFNLQRFLRTALHIRSCSGEAPRPPESGQQHTWEILKPRGGVIDPSFEEGSITQVARPNRVARETGIVAIVHLTSISSRVNSRAVRSCRETKGSAAMPKRPRSTALRYVAAFASLLAALLLTLSARPLFETTAYALFLAAVMFSSWYGGLTPGVIVVLLFVIALDRYFTDGFQRRSGIRTELDLPPTLSRMSRETETTVFRFVQECLTNIHCHSGSPSAHIRIQETSTGLIVEVSDRGHGMPQPNLVDMDGSSAHLGVGIMGMYERVKQAGGSMKISSGNHGTKVTAILPLEVVAVWPE